MTFSATPALALAQQQQQQPLQSGIVRSILSGDTLVLRPKGSTNPSAQKTIHVAGIAAPRLGSRERDDEPQAFSSRDFLRLLTVGKEVRYRVEYTVPVPGGGSREYAHAFLPPRGPGLPDMNVSHEILRAGWAKVHDSNSRRNNPSLPTSEEDEDGGWKAVQRSVQNEAQEEGRGLWGPDSLWKVSHTMPEDSVAFLNEWKGVPIDGIVESVKDGSMLRVRLLLTSRNHQVINLSLAGVKAPRVNGAADRGSSAGGEPFGPESLFFVESRLLQRNVKVHLLSLPQTSSAAPGTLLSGNPAPLTTSYVIGSVQHPAGDIAQFLLSHGLAKLVDWHAGFVNSAFPGVMEKYRAAERGAKEKRAGIWSNWTPPAAAATGSSQTNGANGHAALGARVPGKQFEGVVSRIVTPESFIIKPLSGGAEQRIFLSSVRQPAPREANLAGYGQEAREFLRKKLIGKHVRVHVDYVKPKEGEFEEKHCATIQAIRAGGGQSSKEPGSINEQLISRGLATVQRHRKDDEDRSSEFDKLINAEAAAISEQKGVHSGKENPLVRVPDCSENAGKANSYLPCLKRSGKVAAIVDFVAGASRLKLFVPRENVKITLVLAGIKAPRTGRNANEKDEPFSREGLAYSTERLLQRDVDIEVYGTDKVGGFIGAVFVNRTENIAVGLVENGLAEVHAYSAENVSFGAQLMAAETQAKSQKKGMWHDFVEAVNEAEAPAASSSVQNDLGSAHAAPARKEYVDVIISDVRGNGSDVPFGFAVQVLDDKISQLETLMNDLALAHRSAPPSAPIGFAPRSGDLVSAKFSADGCWYRAQIRRSHPSTKTASIVYIDYGNMEEVSWKDMRPLDITRFGKGRLSPQAQEARLSFVKLYEGKSTEYALDALDRFREAAEGRKLIANIEMREAATMSNGGVPRLHLTLYDPADPNVGNPASCMNMDLVREGWALVDRSVPYAKSQPNMITAFADAEAEARKTRSGIFVYGDPTED
ncbi:hypothetical protein K437DRAFT_252861 [Tilletiaria anomala UBC 951]|uniref:Transcription factor n=1 Tax=Tilletiaria anomala (strain ATCC 24038 / CBS 436.72 / UBC 951) TaxID=1037660 RepID=A0A066WS38_TILAU|nr:uncharacterized protein K437DRAFT_252861 [Tilletiaria anomala UBC 951]KDN53500.1 hypothetical protein K437DRAFT_252861 [Tilletiaria anomala UBC 951]